MARLEDLARGTTVKGILPNRPVIVVDVTWHGANVIDLVYKDDNGNLGRELVLRDREPELEVVMAGDRGALTEMGRCCVWCLRRIAFGWLIYLIRCWRFILLWSSHYLTKLQQFTGK